MDGIQFQTVLVAGAVDRSGRTLYSYTIPDNLPAFPNPPFHVSHIADTGFYDVYFVGEVFAKEPGPVVTATVYGQPIFGDRTDTRDSAIVIDLKRRYARIKTGNDVGKAEDRSFCFTAIGTYEVGISSLADSC